MQFFGKSVSFFIYVIGSILEKSAFFASLNMPELIVIF